MKWSSCECDHYHFFSFPGPEYGTTEAAWKGLFVEADRVCTLHGGIRDQLANDVYTKVKTWQKETFLKQKLGGLKLHKEYDDGFTKVSDKERQYQWHNLLTESRSHAYVDWQLYIGDWILGKFTQYTLKLLKGQTDRLGNSVV